MGGGLTPRAYLAELEGERHAPRSATAGARNSAEGVDAVFSQWRGLMGPRGLTTAQVAYWDGVLGKTVQAKDWKDHIERTQLTYRYLDSAQARDFITDQNEKVREILTGLGLIRK
jgi:putative tricarboxylic transport membrane protein